jgi:hypothetical protein
MLGWLGGGMRDESYYGIIDFFSNFHPLDFLRQGGRKADEVLNQPHDETKSDESASRQSLQYLISNLIYYSYNLSICLFTIRSTVVQRRCRNCTGGSTPIIDQTGR